MEPVIRSIIIYFFLLLVFRLAGKTTLGQMTPFDFVVLLIIGESAQQALTGNDFSVTNGIVIISVLIFSSVVLSLIKQNFQHLEKWLDGTPVIILANGQLLKDRMSKERIDENDILENARQLHGLESLDQIKYAVLEKNGSISIIPKNNSG